MFLLKWLRPYLILLLVHKLINMPLNSIKILQWNCRSLYKRMPDLQYLLFENKIDIALLCETWLNDNNLLSFNNHEIFMNNRNGHGGGVAVLIDKRYRFSLVYDNHINTVCSNNEIEIIIGKVWLNADFHVYVCSIYSPPRGSCHQYTNQHAWKTVFQYLNGLSPIVICGDINGKSALWSNRIHGPDKEGEKLEVAISHTDLFCLNNGENTWLSADLSSASALDITLVSNNIAQKCNWEILASNHGSDHFPIITSIHEVSSNPDFGRPSFSTSNIDWGTFQEECIKFSENFYIDTGNLNATYEELISCIHRSLEIAGATRHKPNNLRKFTPALWWDEECNEIIQKKIKFFVNSKTNPLRSTSQGTLSRVRLHQNSLLKRRNLLSGTSAHLSISTLLSLGSGRISKLFPIRNQVILIT